MLTDFYNIGKVRISCTSVEDASQRIAGIVHDGGSGYICVSNPRTVTYASMHDDYLAVMDSSLMNLPDAEPMLWAARLWGLKSVERTMGPAIFQKMLIEPESGLKHFLLGDTDETLQKVTFKACNEFGASIVGSYSPPFCDIDEYDYAAIAEIINQSGADVVWISMRAPKQDYFASRIVKLLDRKICIGVGAAFRFFIGEYKMAPPIIKKLGLMGLYWGRKNQTWSKFISGYLRDNVPFLFYLAVIPFKRMFKIKYNQ